MVRKLHFLTREGECNMRRKSTSRSSCEARVIFKFVFIIAMDIFSLEIMSQLEISLEICYDAVNMLIFAKLSHLRHMKVF